MRVASDIAHLLPVGGIESCTLEDTLALVERGHQVDAFFGMDGELRPLFETGGVALHGPVPFKVSRRRPVRDLLRFIPAMRSARRLQPDVVWLNRSEHIVWATLIAMAARVKLVTHLHHRPSFPHVRLLTRRVFRFIAVSEFTKRQWIEAGVPADRIEVIYNALPPARYPLGGVEEQRIARSALGLPATGRVITFYGRFSDEKGLLTLLQAFALLDRDDVTLLLAGFFPPDGVSAELRHAVESADPARVRIVPPSSDVIPFLHAADVVISPSWVAEAFGRSIVETMSTGRPVIGTRVGAVPELLEGGMDRLLVPSRDPEALLEAILGVLDWRDAEPDLGSACRSWVETRFPYETHVARVEALLETAARR